MSIIHLWDLIQKYFEYFYPVWSLSSTKKKRKENPEVKTQRVQSNNKPPLKNKMSILVSNFQDYLSSFFQQSDLANVTGPCRVRGKTRTQISTPPGQLVWPANLTFPRFPGHGPFHFYSRTRPGKLSVCLKLRGLGDRTFIAKTGKVPNKPVTVGCPKSFTTYICSFYQLDKMLLVLPQLYKPRKSLEIRNWV